MTRRCSAREKEAEDTQLSHLQDIREKSGLHQVHIVSAIAAFSSMSQSGRLHEAEFFQVYVSLLQEVGVPAPSEEVCASLFQLFDRDGNGSVDMAELVCAVSTFCAGTEHEKLEAIFKLFDVNGDGAIDFDEMYKFVASIFRVVLTPQAIFQMNSEGAHVDSAEDLASQVASECFAVADINVDGKISLEEFVIWLNEGGNHCLLFPTFDQLHT